MQAREMSLRLHGHDVYQDFDPSPYPDDIQGWNSQHPLLQEVIRVKKPGIIIEIGVWKGASAIFMAEQLRMAKIPSVVIGVDTFLGSVTHLTRPESRASLNPRHGWPQLYYQFMANVVRRDLQNFICPFAQTSETAFQYFSQLNLRPDVVHIDAAHDYESVSRDITNFFSLLTPGGALVGDDFSAEWPEVIWAATEFAKRNRLALQQLRGKFLIQKDHG
jgi:predicted O-methyltransferase YrrM